MIVCNRTNQIAAKRLSRESGMLISANLFVVFTAQYGPGRTGQIYAYFAKKSVTICLRQVRPVNFRSTKFCQSLPNFKDAVVLPRSRTNFLSGVKSDRFVYLHTMI